MIDLKKLLSNIAPTIATALGGPIAGTAVKFLSDKLLGKSDATPEQIADAINSATPEQLLKLKELDANFAIEIGKQGVDLYNLEVQDRSSARMREENLAKAGTRDWIAPLLAVSVVLGFFIALYIVDHDGDLNQADQFILVTISNMTMLVLSYYFGSSNKDKNK